jgi:NitT/TauT family transport system substrate-binding protein
MFKCRNQIALAFSIVVGLGPTLGKAQDKAQEIDVVLALPAATLTFSAPFIAQDAGFFKKEGLRVSVRNIVGVGSVNAVISGSADFTMGTGPVFLRAAAQGQRMLAIVNVVDRPMVELVLRKDLADAAGITDKMPLAERAKAMKGKTIAIQGVGSIVHAWQRLVASRGGLDLEKDVRIAPMDPPAMLPALENKVIDGYATSMPFTTQAIVKGSAVMLATATSDAADLTPFAYGLVYARPETCRDKREKCARMARAMTSAAKFIREKPAEALEVLRKRFDKLDPQVLNAAWQVVSKAHAQDTRVTIGGLENSQRVSIEAGLLDPKDALKSFDGLFTDEFLR